MNETEYSFTSPSVQNVCRICVTTENTRPMSSDEITWYQNITFKILPPTQELKLNICRLCGHLLNKYTRFSKQCQNAQSILDGDIKEDINSFFTLTHEMGMTIPKTYYLGPESFAEEVAIKTENYDDDNCDNINDDTFHDDEGKVQTDDDLPLVLLSKLCDEGISVKDKSEKRRKKSKKIKNNLKKIREDASTEVKSRRMKKLREGFTPRMVQETDEYIVIKLTKEQVLQEMQEKANSNKYKRSLYKCELCVKGFNFEDVLMGHIDKAHSKDKGEFKCDLCSQYCKNQVSLRGHLKSHTTRYKCKVCGSIRLSRQHLLEHHALSHTSQPPEYSCQHCPFTSNKRTVMQRHVRSSHRGGERFECHRCGRLCHSMEALRVHVTRHDKHKALQCSQCGLQFIYPSLLERHVNAVHERKEYYCVECDIRFKCFYNLQLHYKKAKRHKDPQILRNSLPETPPQEQTTHKNVDSQQYSCSVCDKTFSRKNMLAVHMKTHTQIEIDDQVK